MNRLCNSRRDLPRTDKSHCSSLHIQVDNWALGRSRSQQRCGSELLSTPCVSMGMDEGVEAVGLVIYATANILD